MTIADKGDSDILRMLVPEEVPRFVPSPQGQIGRVCSCTDKRRRAHESVRCMNPILLYAAEMMLVDTIKLNGHAFNMLPPNYTRSVANHVSLR
jgi:hypothetical protein